MAFTSSRAVSIGSLTLSMVAFGWGAAAIPDSVAAQEQTPKKPPTASAADKPAPAGPKAATQPREPSVDSNASQANHARLGVILAEHPAEIDGHDGVRINHVLPEGPADEAGLQPGDRIISADGKTLEKPEELVAAIAAKKPGDKISLVVSRNGKDKTIAIELAAADALHPAFDPRAYFGGEEHRAWLGIFLHDREGDKVEVARVYKKGPAAAAGIKQGDTIVSLDDKPVTSSEKLIEILSQLDPKEEIKLVVLRDGKEKTLDITPDRTPMARAPMPPHFGSPDSPWGHPMPNPTMLMMEHHQHRLEMMLHQLHHEIEQLRAEVRELKGEASAADSRDNETETAAPQER
jgi:S1-C subfamily serine protease